MKSQEHYDLRKLGINPQMKFDITDPKELSELKRLVKNNQELPSNITLVHKDDFNSNSTPVLIQDASEINRIMEYEKINNKLPYNLRKNMITSASTGEKRPNIMMLQI